MIRIIEYVLAKAGDRSVSADSRTKYRQLAKSLSAYIGEGRDEDIIVQARPGWIDGYHRFLCDTYEGNKDRTADPSHLPELRRRRAADHLRTLRRINYNAVAEGILPDVDFLAGIDGPDLSRTRPVTSPDFGTQLRRLIDIRATDSTFAGPIDRYLLCVCLCGLPPGRLPEVLQAITPDTVSVHLPHLGLDLPLGDALRRKALAVKSRRESTHTGQDKGKHSSGNYTLLFSHLGVTLCRSGSPFTDWLSLMMQAAGAGAPDILGLMRLYDAQAARDPAGHDALPMPGTDTILPQAASFITGYESAVERKHYYAVKVYGTSAEDLLADLPASAPDIRSILDGNVWCPCTTTRPTTNVERIVARRGKVVDERRTVMRDLFFARATTADISRLDRTVPNLWVFQTREGTRRRYTRISPLELSAMRSILDRIGAADDIEFTVTDTPLSTGFAAGDTVLLLLPGFEDLEARVTKKISAAGTYTIHLLSPDGKHITMTVPPTALKAVNKE